MGGQHTEAAGDGGPRAVGRLRFTVVDYTLQGEPGESSAGGKAACLA